MNRFDLARRRQVLALAVAVTVLLVAAPRSGAADECPASNPPNTLRVVDGSPQTAQLGQTFQTNLQVALANTNGCQVTGDLGNVAVTFTAPSSGPSGTFASSGTNQVTVATDATGNATAPPFAANDTTGGYIVNAGSKYGAAQLSLTNECPTSNSPNTLRVVGGSPQTAQLSQSFQTNLQVALANTNGCQVTGDLGGIAVTFTAPGSGPSGTFASSGTNQVTVGTDASGNATAPTFTANDTAGGYIVNTSTKYRAVQLSLANTTDGLPATIAAVGASRQKARVNRRYGQPLRARVLDARGRPAHGVSVTFSLTTGRTGAGGTFTGGATTATATTTADGIATSPPLIASKTAGRFTAAAAAGAGGGGGDGSAGSSRGGGPAVTPRTYKLENIAGRPAAITTGAADGQSTRVGRRFAIPLAVRVTDADGNAVSGAWVMVRAPARNASGRFTTGRRTARVKTNRKGIAIAPAFTANRTPGGYVVIASVIGTHKRVAFALVNRPRR